MFDGWLIFFIMTRNVLGQAFEYVWTRVNFELDASTYSSGVFRLAAYCKCIILSIFMKKLENIFICQLPSAFCSMEPVQTE